MTEDELVKEATLLLRETYGASVHFSFGVICNDPLLFRVGASLFQGKQETTLVKNMLWAVSLDSAAKCIACLKASLQALMPKRCSECGAWETLAQEGKALSGAQERQRGTCPWQRDGDDEALRYRDARQVLLENIGYPTKDRK